MTKVKQAIKETIENVKFGNVVLPPPNSVEIICNNNVPNESVVLHDCPFSKKIYKYVNCSKTLKFEIVNWRIKANKWLEITRMFYTIKKSILSSDVISETCERMDLIFHFQGEAFHIAG